jgi:pimeloyl-ACP methyl ester carboxylesterase
VDSKGKVLVILHGWASSPERWRKVKRLIEKNSGWRVLAPSLPGFKTKLKKPWGLDGYVKWLKKWLDDQELKQVVLLGHSFGGRVAIKFAVKNPKRVERLILVDAAGIKDKRWLTRLKIGTFGWLANRFSFLKSLFPLSQIVRRFIYLALREKDYLSAEPVLRETMAQIIKEDLEPLLSEIKTPTLIIWGEKDRVTPLWMGETFKLKMKNATPHHRGCGARLKIIKGVGHSPHLEAPERLARVVIGWLKN